MNKHRKRVTEFTDIQSIIKEIFFLRVALDTLNGVIAKTTIVTVVQLSDTKWYMTI